MAFLTIAQRRVADVNVFELEAFVYELLRVARTSAWTMVARRARPWAWAHGIDVADPTRIAVR
jgi:hypothetical protein